MYFGTKSYLKSNHYHTPKHPLRGFCEVLLPRRCSSSFLPQLISKLHPTPRTNTLIEICPFHIRAMASLCLSPTAAVTLIIRPPSWINLESF